jgi:hypothetical protein
LKALETGERYSAQGGEAGGELPHRPTNLNLIDLLYRCYLELGEAAQQQTRLLVEKNIFLK